MEIICEFVSTVFVVKDNKVLMTWNRKINNWVPIGGHIEKNELPCDSVIREAKEESGLDIELVSPYDKSKYENLIQPVNLHLDNVREDHKHVNLMYFALVKGGECFEVDDEGKELKWFSREEIEALNLFPHIKYWALEALNHLGKRN